MNNMDNKNLLFVGGDLSGIQKFIYNITSKRAMVSLKGRSSYLKDFTKKVYNEILDIPEIKTLKSDEKNGNLLFWWQVLSASARHGKHKECYS